VPRGVADDIRLGLDDPAAGDAFGHLPHQHLADEITSERDRIDRQLCARERWMAILMPARFQGIRSQYGERGRWPARPNISAIRLTRGLRALNGSCCFP
jgi:hypothetical protein